MKPKQSTRKDMKLKENKLIQKKHIKINSIQSKRKKAEADLAPQFLFS